MTETEVCNVYVEMPVEASDLYLFARVRAPVCETSHARVVTHQHFGYAGEDVVR